MNVPTKKQKNKNPKKKTKKIRPHADNNDYLDEIKQEFITNKCDESENMHSDKCNDISTKKEELEMVSDAVKTLDKPVIEEKLICG